MTCALTNRASAVVLKLLIFFEVSSSNLLTASGAMSECLSWICFSRLNVQTNIVSHDVYQSFSDHWNARKISAIITIIRTNGAPKAREILGFYTRFL